MIESSLMSILTLQWENIFFQSNWFSNSSEMCSGEIEDGTHLASCKSFLSVGKNLFIFIKIKWSCDRLFLPYCVDFKHVSVQWVGLSALLSVERLSIFLYQGKFCCVEDIAYFISWKTVIILRIENKPIWQKFIQEIAKYC